MTHLVRKGDLGYQKHVHCHVANGVLITAIIVHARRHVIGSRWHVCVHGDLENNGIVHMTDYLTTIRVNLPLLAVTARNRAVIPSR